MSSRATSKRKRSAYALTLVFRSTKVGATGIARPLCEHTVVLICAATRAAAIRSAMKYGYKQELSYINNLGKQVRWSFVGIEQACEAFTPRKGEPWEISWSHRNRSVRALAQIARSSRNGLQDPVEG